MIKWLTIRNFQSHKLTQLKFVDGINVIHGFTDSGKSAVLRALRWIAYNVPRGDGFVAPWLGKKSCRAVVGLADGHTVARERGEGVNCYWVDGEKMAGFGQNVPDQVSHVLDLPDVNWQRQHDPAFLLSMPPPAVARYLNKIADLEDIDLAQTRINAKSRNIGSSLRIYEKELETTKASLKEFKGLDDVDGYLESLEIMDAERSALEKKAARLSKLIEEIASTKEELHSLLDVSPIVSQIEALEAIREKIDDTQEEELEEIVGELMSLRREQEELEEKIKELEEDLPEVCPVCGSEIQK